MDNRTIRNAIAKRIPEIYFIHAPQRVANKVYWRMLANIDGKLYKFLADMPSTALVSHRELLNTLVSEVYDEVKAIKRKLKTPPTLPQEKDWTPLSEDDKRLLGIDSVDDAMRDNALHYIASAHIPDVSIEKKPDEKPKLILSDE